MNQPRNLFLNSFWEKYPSADRVLSLFKIKNSPLKPVVARVLNKFDNFKNNVTSIGFKKDASFIYTGSEDGSIKIYDLKT